jgi:predicted dinucleotide-utilizing enzyme
LVEVEATDGKVTKWVVRFPLNTSLDMVLAMTGDYIVKTVWVNRTNDPHATLDVHQYDRPEPVGV